MQQGTRERDALALAAGDHLAALAHHMVEAIRQGFDELVRAGGAQGAPDFLVAETLLAQRNIVPDAVMEQRDILPRPAMPAAIA